MADNTIANAIKFLKGEEKSLPATKTEGQVYFAYKNVGTAEKPSYTGAIYIDTPIGGIQNRIKMTANADIADKAFNDSAGLNIRETYLSSLGYTDDGKQTILIKGSGNNQTRIALPIASTIKSGIVTTDAQSFGGTKTFTTIKSINLTITGDSGFNYSGIGPGTVDAVRPVWFADNSSNGKPVVNTNFTYNPATQTLSVANLSGTADKANKDNAGYDIRSTYISSITVNGTTLTITKGSGATSSITLQDTNDKVTQTAVKASDYTNWRTILWGSSNSGVEGFTPTTVTDCAFTSDTLTFQPSSGTLKAKIFKGSLSGNAASANKLTTARTLWGQSFDGTGNVSGQISGCTRIMNANSGSLSLGNADNTGWVYTQDIASQAGQNQWMINQQGLGTFKNINIGYLYDERDTSYALKVKGNTLYNGKIYFANNTAYYINESADANLRAVGTNDKTYIVFPQGGGYRDTIDSITGYLKITLPVTWTSTMMSFKVTIYEYQDNLSCTYYLSGYNYGGSDQWYSTSAYSLSKSDSRTISDRTVRFGHDGSKCAIYIGESNSTWNYPKVQISDIIVGHSTYDYTIWASGWSVGFTTTLGTISSTITKPCISNSAATLQTNAGSATRPVYFSGGIPVQCNDTLANSISGKSASTDAINWVASNEIRFTRPASSNATSLHIGYKWADGTSSKLINEYIFEGGDGISTQVTASQFNGSLNGNANTATNADKLDGFHGSSDPTANTYVLRSNLGYIYTNYINSNTSNNENPSISQIIVTNGSDNFYRKASLSHLKNSLGSMPASDVYSWAKASTKPSYSWGEITGKPSTFTPSFHTHDYVVGSYTGNGGQQNPNYFGMNKVGFLMMNTTVNGDSSYKDWIIMDCYSGSDVGGGVALGVNRQKLAAYIMRSDASRKAWAESAELLHTSNYTSYTVTKSGSGASGTWGINITGSAGSVAWGNVSGRPSSLPASDVYAWAKASSKPSYSWSEITNKPSSFNPSSHTHPYLPLAGGTMTGTINFTANKLACNFRSDSGDFASGVMHQSYGNEALVFATTKAVTSFIFKCGQNPTSMTSNTWTNITPSMMIKNQSVYINYSVANGATPIYNFCVNGTTRCRGTLGVGAGSGSAEIDFFSSSSSTIGARIKAYNDRIEFVFS